MIALLIFLAFALIMIVVMVVARQYDVKIINIKNGQLEFWQPKKTDAFSFYPCFTLDPVISEDGKIYKIHLMMNIISEKELSPTNWMLEIYGIGRFNFKQYFIQNQNGSRIPLGKMSKLPLNLNETFIIGLEFEPEGEYIDFSFSEKKYKANLICKIANRNSKHLFYFFVRSRNLTALKLSSIEAKRKKIAVVTSFPILMK